MSVISVETAKATSLAKILKFLHFPLLAGLPPGICGPSATIPPTARGPGAQGERITSGQGFPIRRGERLAIRTAGEAVPGNDKEGFRTAAEMLLETPAGHRDAKWCRPICWRHMVVIIITWASARMRGQSLSTSCAEALKVRRGFLCRQIMLESPCELGTARPDLHSLKSAGKVRCQALPLSSFHSAMMPAQAMTAIWNGSSLGLTLSTFTKAL